MTVEPLSITLIGVLLAAFLGLIVHQMKKISATLERLQVDVVKNTSAINADLAEAKETLRREAAATLERTTDLELSVASCQARHGIH